MSTFNNNSEKPNIKNKILRMREVTWLYNVARRQISSHLIGAAVSRRNSSETLSGKFLCKNECLALSTLKGYCGNMTKYWTILYSLTFTRTFPVSENIDIGDHQPRVMEEMWTYEVRFLPIRTSTQYYI